MRLIIQRVQSASVDINNSTHNQIRNGLLCFVGFCDKDEKSDFKWAINKISNLKLFKNQTSVYGWSFICTNIWPSARIFPGFDAI